MTRPSCPGGRMRPPAGSGFGRRCQELSRGSWGSAMGRRASHREPAKTARPALSTAPLRCLACMRRSPGRPPRRILRPGGLTLQGLLGPRDICVSSIFFVQSFQVSRSKIASFRYDRDDRADGRRAKSFILNNFQIDNHKYTLIQVRMSTK